MDERARELTRYLLGELPEEEARQVELEYLRSEESFELMLALEDELFLDYARSDLSGERRRRFEARFLRGADGARRLAEVRLLTGALVRGRRSPPAILWWAAAAALVAATSLWTISGSAPPDDPERSISAVGRRTRPADPAAVPVVELSAGAAPRRIALPARAQALELRLRGPASPGPRRLVLRGPGGRSVWESEVSWHDDGVAARVVQIPTARLSGGAYELGVADPGGGEVLRFAFVVSRD